MSLSIRAKAFEKLSSRFVCSKPSPLIAIHKIDPKVRENLATAAAVYLSRNLSSNRLILDEQELLGTIVDKWKEIPTITPNGMVVPKRHTMLEYNALVRAFAATIATLNIADLISSWHIPLNVRIKLGAPDENNLRRHHPTEHIHSDSWAGESSESVTVHIPLFGDTERNRMVFYEPPSQFDEDWLKPLPSYQAGKDIADRYKKMDCKVQKGELVLADFSTLHSSSHFPNAGARASIDTTFVLKKSDAVSERIHPWREGERASDELLRGIGETHFFVFADSAEQQVDSQGGFKHPTSLQILKLLES